MADDMVERVARAIELEDRGGSAMARAAIAAMRVAPYVICTKAGAGVTPGMASVIWANMIDAALSTNTEKTKE